VGPPGDLMAHGGIGSLPASIRAITSGSRATVAVGSRKSWPVARSAAALPGVAAGVRGAGARSGGNGNAASATVAPDCADKLAGRGGKGGADAPGGRGANGTARSAARMAVGLTSSVAWSCPAGGPAAGASAPGADTHPGKGGSPRATVGGDPLGPPPTPADWPCPRPACRNVGTATEARGTKAGSSAGVPREASTGSAGASSRDTASPPSRESVAPDGAAPARAGGAIPSGHVSSARIEEAFFRLSCSSAQARPKSSARARSPRAHSAARVRLQ